MIFQPQTVTVTKMLMKSRAARWMPIKVKQQSHF
jgi:hypothetical protein